MDKEQAIRNVTDAIEAFTDAKIRRFDAHTAGRNTGAGTCYQIDVDETREHMRDKLRELLS